MNDKLQIAKDVLVELVSQRRAQAVITEDQMKADVDFAWAYAVALVAKAESEEANAPQPPAGF
jgi:hypothetical protein